MSSHKVRQCHSCKSLEAKYTCPRCSTYSCCLNCVQHHKKIDNCSGVRDRVKYIPQAEMTPMDVANDYRFLEEIDSKVQDVLRNQLRRHIVSKQATELPFHLSKLQNECKSRGIHLVYLPQVFRKHQINTTRYHFKDQKIHWHIEWEFPQANLTFVDEAVPEDLTIYEIISKYMEPTERFRPFTSNEHLNLSEEQSEQLGFYQSKGYKDITILFKCDGGSKDFQFIEIKLSKSLKWNLSNKKIVEYPTLIVIQNEHLEAYLDDVENHKAALVFELLDFKKSASTADPLSFNNYGINVNDEDADCD